MFVLVFFTITLTDNQQHSKCVRPAADDTMVGSPAAVDESFGRFSAVDTVCDGLRTRTSSSPGQIWQIYADDTVRDAPEVAALAKFGRFTGDYTGFG